MWSITLPSPERIEIFLADQRRESVSYGEVRGTQGAMPPGYNHDCNRVRLGAGEQSFVAGCAALRAWKMFPTPWTKILPPHTPIKTGQTVAMLAHVYGLWWMNACRIVYTIDDSGPVRRFGFAYGTLPGHVEKGEEVFVVEWLADDSVWYEVKAFSRPRFWLVKLTKPLARYQQRRFARDSKAAMVRAVQETSG